MLKASINHCVGRNNTLISWSRTVLLKSDSINIYRFKFETGGAVVTVRMPEIFQFHLDCPEESFKAFSRYKCYCTSIQGQNTDCLVCFIVMLVFVYFQTLVLLKFGGSEQSRLQPMLQKYFTAYLLGGQGGTVHWLLQY